jgi:hypothetical protein
MEAAPAAPLPAITTNDVQSALSIQGTTRKVNGAHTAVIWRGKSATFEVDTKDVGTSIFPGETRRHQC